MVDEAVAVTKEMRWNNLAQLIAYIPGGPNAAHTTDHFCIVSVVADHKT